MMELIFSIPGEPKGLARAKASVVRGHARMYDPSSNKFYKNLVAIAAKKSADDLGWRITGKPVAVEIRAFFSIPQSWSKKKRQDAAEARLHHTRKPDADNVIKMILDGINSVLVYDDKQVVEVHCRKAYSYYPRTEVAIWVVDEIG